MKLFIDSSQKKFIACLFDNSYKPIYKSIIETKYKVEEIINFFDHVPHFNEIEQIYINIGPGSFTGSRIALLYVRTMAQLNSNIKIYCSTTFEIINQQIKKSIFNKKIYINATKNKSYCWTKEEISIVDKNKKEIEINYDDLINNFEKYISIFEIKHLENIKPIYVGEPQIGEMKS